MLKFTELKVRHLLLVIWVLGTVALAEHVEPSGQTPMESQKPRPVTESNKQVPKPMTMEEALAKGNTHLLVDPKTHELLSPTGKPFKISVLTEETAEKIFKEMAEQKHIPFCYPEDGCYARAHEMTRLMEKKGVIAGKVFIEGDLKVETTNSPKGYVEWWYHVAPLVAIKKENKIEMFVIDPSLTKKPISVEDWVKLQISHPAGKKDELYHTERFIYTPSKKSGQLTDYQKQDLADTQTTLQTYLEAQKARLNKK